MKVTVLGATGSLGRNVVDAALARGHAVTALVRRPGDASLPESVRIVEGDATDPVRVAEVSDVDTIFFCVNPPFDRWETDFPPLLETALAAARRSRARFVFPANVWIYGEVPAGASVDETRSPSPTSRRGRLRLSMERTILGSGVDVRILRLPEFYGPHVNSLTAGVFRAVLRRRPVLWPGPLSGDFEVVYMPDAAIGMVRLSEVGDVPTSVHFPGVRTTAAGFVEAVGEAAGEQARAWSIPGWVLAAAGAVHGMARGAHDIRHLFTHPVLLDGRLARRALGDLPCVPLPEGIHRTLAWYRDHPSFAIKV
ncbi:MAG: NAD(P)H-binding protein [Polyangiaceae bacterium]